MSNIEEPTKKLIRLTRERMARTGESFSTAGEAVMRANPMLADAHINDSQLPEEDRARLDNFDNSWERRAEAGEKLVRLTRKYMAETGEMNFTKASFIIMKQHPDLVEAYHRDIEE